jgi:anti-sigma factor RsiW
MKCNPEVLEELAGGRLDGARAAEVTAHAAGCDDCARELEWLRAERELFARRAASAGAPPAQRLWRGIERRIAETPRRSAFSRLALPAVLAAAAALAVVAWNARRVTMEAPTERVASTSSRVEHRVTGAGHGADGEYAAQLASVVLGLEPPP